MSAFHQSVNRDSPEGDKTLAALEELVDALRQHGGRVSADVCFKRAEDEGVGIFTREGAFLAAGSTVVEVPFRFCISVDLITSIPTLRTLFEEQPQLLDFPDEVLALGLMWGATTTSDDCPFATHIRTLPPIGSFNTTLFWTEEELSELKGCTVFHLTQLMKRQIASDWSSLHQPLSEAYPDILGNVTVELYMWALSVVYSRAVGFSKNGSYVRVIPPVLDMANHDPSAATEASDTFDYSPTEDMLRLIASSERGPGEECFAVYGTYPNAKLAFTYGFVIHGCPHRAVDLWTRVLPSTSFAERKQALLRACPLTSNQTYDFTGTLRDGSISGALLASIRVIQASEDELDEMEQSAGDFPFVGRMISVRNEAATYRSLRELLQTRLNVEVAEADKQLLGEMLLAEPPFHPSNRKLMALIIRTDERDLVQDCLALVIGYEEQLEIQGEAYIPPDSTSAATDA